jgi:hypothetical protein
MGLNFVFFLNLWTHVLILWIALIALFWLLISKKESEVLTNEFTQQISENLLPALISANESSDGSLKIAMKPLLPSLELIEKQYDVPDKATSDFNNMLLLSAILVAVALLSVLITALVVAKIIGKYDNLKKHYFFTLFENVILFIFVGAVEAAFFIKVSAKYVPIAPDVIITRLIDDIKNSFSPKKMVI